MKMIVSALMLLVIISCSEKNKKEYLAVHKIDTVWLNSIIKKSDSVYSKPYKRTDFVTAIFYINKKDSTVCQIMKDSANQLRQVLISKKNIRTHFSQYYPNGQLVEKIPLNEFGQNDGRFISYYNDGQKKEEGSFKNGLYAGDWKNFDENGKLVFINRYNSNGNLIESIKQ